MQSKMPDGNESGNMVTGMKEINLNQFKVGLAEVINYHSIDNLLNVPDFILAEFLNNIIAALVAMNEAKRKWETPNGE
jgi:hypothetical protein